MRIDADALRAVVSGWPWTPGELSPAEAALLRRYVASNPWGPGEPGKGIVTPLGAVVTWATYDRDGEPDVDGAPWHEHVIRALYPQLLGEYGDVPLAFLIDADGTIDARGLDDIANAPVTRARAHIERLSDRPYTTAVIDGRSHVWPITDPDLVDDDDDHGWRVLEAARGRSA